MTLRASRVPKLPELLAAMTPVVRSSMLQRFTPNCCIATCKILIDVFAYYSYKARAVPMRLAVYNAEMVRLLRSKVPLPSDRIERLELFSQTGAWGVGITDQDMLFPSSPEGEKGFGGHLVLQVGGLLVDGSLQQAQRLERGIVLPSLAWFETSAGFFAPRAKGQTERRTIGDSLAVYQRIENDGYRISPNWRQQHAGQPDVFHSILTLTSLELERARKRVEAP